MTKQSERWQQWQQNHNSNSTSNKQNIKNSDNENSRQIRILSHTTLCCLMSEYGLLFAVGGVARRDARAFYHCIMCVRTKITYEMYVCDYYNKTSPMESNLSSCSLFYFHKF